MIEISSTEAEERLEILAGAVAFCMEDKGTMDLAPLKRAWLFARTGRIDLEAGKRSWADLRAMAEQAEGER